MSSQRLARVVVEPFHGVAEGTHLLTVPELAAMLRLTRKGIYALVEARRIPFIRVSNRVRFRRSDVLRWLEENCVPATVR